MEARPPQLMWERASSRDQLRHLHGQEEVRRAEAFPEEAIQEAFPEEATQEVVPEEATLEVVPVDLRTGAVRPVWLADRLFAR